ncbi:MAG: hypothetical protein IPG18_18130 [Saprospiraceae bacterium]|nr:hypothetical protein [Saprospiraceae bacterium]
MCIEFHDDGLKLNIEDIDPSFTIGQLEMLKETKIIQRLKEEGKLDSNKLITIPSSRPEKLPLFLSETAAGYIDFGSADTTEYLRLSVYTYLIFCCIAGKQYRKKKLQQL